MLKNVLIAIFILTSLSAQAENGYVAGKLGMWSFSTSGISANDESASGFGAYVLETGYSLTNKLQVVAGFNVLLSDGIGGQTGFGFDLGGRYFPFTDAGSALTTAEDVSIRITEDFRPYVGLFFRQRTFNFILSTTFVGAGISMGFDYQMARNWYLNAEFRYDQLYGPDEGEASQMNILFGGGFEF